MLRPCAFQPWSRTTTSTPLLPCTVLSSDVTFEGSSAIGKAELHFVGKIYVPPPGLEEYVVNGEKVRSAHMMRATVPFNLARLSALSVPFSFSSEQLPINVQLISKWFDEATILRLGQLIEPVTDAQSRHPNL